MGRRRSRRHPDERRLHFRSRRPERIQKHRRHPEFHRKISKAYFPRSKAKGEATGPGLPADHGGQSRTAYHRFEVLVDGTNGDTNLQPVQATLGSTQFQTSGAVIKHEGAQTARIDLDVLMPKGNLRDVLRLAMKGSPFMEGQLFLKTRIAIPPLSGQVTRKTEAERSISDLRRQIFEVHHTG